MKLWLCTDEDGRLLGLNPHDMTGNTGWQEAVDASVLDDDPMLTSLTDARGIACYKVSEGVVYTRMAEEMNADYTEPEEMKTENERIAKLEETDAMLTECLLEMSELVYA